MQIAQLSLTQKQYLSLRGLRSSLILAAGFCVLLTSSSFAAWGGFGFWRQEKAWPFLVLCSLAYFVPLGVLRQFQRLPRAQTVRLVLVTVALSFGSVVVISALGRLYYSRTFLLVSFAVTLVSFLLAFEFRARVQPLRLAVVPSGIAHDLLALKGVKWILLDRPELPGSVDGLVVDWHEKLSPQWVRLLSNCSLKRLPVYHSAVVFEAGTGRVSLAHMSEGLMDEFVLPPFYALFKRGIDVAAVLFFSPLVLLLAALVALAIRVDSPGPVLFWQDRVGQGGRPFRMCKFRSMGLAADEDGARFAGHGDPRVTRVGRFIRASRLDELPQLWNILKGEMSLIGPRPEQVPFARQFETEIPFYAYRHLVKPGLTGWAQVTQGYAAGVDQNRAKLEHDLYYIKYFSFWLDLWILGRTLRTVLTGFGAR